jgi:hypothetical protein
MFVHRFSSPANVAVSLNTSIRVTTMHDLLLPFEMFWAWVTKNFGLPGQMLVTCAAILFVLAMFVWVGNRRGGTR